ncbi:putative tick transposon, partial [Operophtera brumata]
MLKSAGYDILNKVDENYCTRETMTTSTILDHICSNLHDDQFHVTIIESPLSDHKQIFMELKKYKHNTLERISYEAVDYYTLYNTMKTDKFINEDHEYETLALHLKSQIQLHKRTKIKILNLPQKDWINKDITDGICNRNMTWK